MTDDFDREHVEYTAYKLDGIKPANRIRTKIQYSAVLVEARQVYNKM